MTADSQMTADCATGCTADMTADCTSWLRDAVKAVVLLAYFLHSEIWRAVSSHVSVYVIYVTAPTFLLSEVTGASRARSLSI